MSQTKMTFEEFKNRYEAREISHPDSLSVDDVLKRIWEHEKNFRGIDWLQAHNEGKDALISAVTKAQNCLLEQTQKLSADEIEMAKKMGLVNEHGIVPDISGAFFENLTETPSPTTFPDGAPSYTIWGWNEETVAKYQSAKGEDVEKYIVNLVNNFQVMENDDAVGIVRICMEAGIIGFGVLGISAAAQILITLSELTEATEAYAVLEGVLTIGINIIRLLVSTVILAILIPLMILMSKNAFGLFVIVNNTSSDLVMNDIYFTHGKCVAGFKKDADADNPQAVIPKIFDIYNPQKPMKAICAGFLGVKKRDNALIGTRGAMSFATTNEYPSGIYIGWEVPLSIGENRILVSATFNGSVSDFSDQTDSSGTLDSSSHSPTDHVIEGHLSSGSGSKSYAFFFAN